MTAAHGGFPDRAAREVGVDVRLRSALAVYAFGVLGAFLVLAPWSAVYGNVLVWSEVDAGWGRVLASGWFRGMISGVGLLDLAVAVREGLRLRGGAAGSVEARRP